SFSHMETPDMHLHVMGTIIVDPSTMAGGYSFETIKRTVASRIHLIPPFRRRLVEVPFRLGNPVWVDDGTFDLDAHVHRIGLPAPLGLAKMLVKTGQGVARVVQTQRNKRPDAPPATLPFTAPRTPFNGAITPHRAVAYGRASLDDMKTVKNAFGTTVNDVVLA